MSDSFRTTEEELNFILGNDVGQLLFDIDSALQDEEDLPPLPPAASAAAQHDGDRDCALSFDAVGGARFAAAATTTGATMADGGGGIDDFQDAVISRMVSLSPTFAFDGNNSGGALQTFNVFNESLMMSDPLAKCTPQEHDLLARFAPEEHDMLPSKFAPQELEVFKDFNFDLSDDILPSIFPSTSKFCTSPVGPPSYEQPHMNIVSPAQNLLQQFQQYQIPLPLPPPYSSVVSEKKRPSCNFPPIVHPAHLSTVPKRPLRKRKVEVTNLIFNPASSPTSCEGGAEPVQAFDPTVAHVKAMEARTARKMRRILRAKSQAINLVGGGDISEIKRHAVMDSDYTRLSSQAALVSDFSRNFNPKMFVDLTFEQVYQTMVKTANADEAAEVAAATMELQLEPDYSPSPQPIEATSISRDIFPPAKKSGDNNIQTTQTPKAVITPTKEINCTKTLPSGKDPESRKLRRLMRNRLSAQASRDRRKKAIEDAQKQKAAKEEEIASLEKTLSKVSHCILTTFTHNSTDTIIICQLAFTGNTTYDAIGEDSHFCKGLPRYRSILQGHQPRQCDPE